MAEQESSSDDGNFKGVMVDWDPKVLQATDLPCPHYFKNIFLIRSGIDSPKWTTLPLTTKLGISIKGMKLTGPPELQPFAPGENTENRSLSILSANLDQDSKNFGAVPKAGTGPWFFGRGDCFDMDDKQFQSIEAFIKEVLGEVAREKAKGELTEEQKMAFVGKINKEEFKAFFAKHCDTKGWTDAACPV